MSKHSTMKALEIPELAILVIDRLNRTDLAACAQLNRSWHEAVIPFLYASVTIGARSPETRLGDASWDGFRKHSRHMRQLEVHSSSIYNIPHVLRCTGLTTFCFEISDDSIPCAYWATILLRLLSRNRGISTIRLKSFCKSAARNSEHHSIVLGLLRYVPGLKSLFIAGTSLGRPAVDEIMRCAHRLEELDVTIIRVDEGPARRTTVSRLKSNLASISARLSLEDHDDPKTHDGPYIQDSFRRQCRQGFGLKKFSFTLNNQCGRNVKMYGDLSRLVRLCCSAEDVQLFFLDRPNRRTGFLTLYEEVGHPAWRLKHLYIGFGGLDVVAKILSVCTSPLVSFRLWNCNFSDELLSVLLQYHGKTLQRVSFGNCRGFLLKARVEAMLSRCPDLQSLDLYTYERGVDRRKVMAGGIKSQWTGPNGRVFKVLLSHKAFWVPVRASHEAMGADTMMDQENPIPDDPWKQLELMESFKIKSHIRFLAS
ncbi:unnamed protein product [Mortierella alpina]